MDVQACVASLERAIAANFPSDEECADALGCIRALAAEVERLKVALRQIAKHESVTEPTGETAVGWIEGAGREFSYVRKLSASEIARKALPSPAGEQGE